MTTCSREDTSLHAENKTEGLWTYAYLILLKRTSLIWASRTLSYLMDVRTQFVFSQPFVYRGFLQSPESYINRLRGKGGISPTCVEAAVKSFLLLKAFLSISRRLIELLRTMGDNDDI